MGNYTAVATLFPGSPGFWAFALPTQPYERWVKRIIISGPPGSNFGLYFHTFQTAPIDQTSRGDRNMNDYSNPLLIPKGYRLIGAWDNGLPPVLGSAATCVFSMEREA